MYCIECGSELKNEALFCSQCGRKIDICNNKPNVVAIVGFVFSFIVGIVGLICSVIGYKRANLYDSKFKNLALAGIIISEITITWQITFASVMATFLLIVLS